MLQIIIQSALVLKSVLAAAPFVAPYSQSDSWSVLGDARITDNLVELVQSPNQQGAVWSKAPVTYSEWTLEAVLKTKAGTKVGSVDKSGYSLWYTSKQLQKGDVHGSEDNWDGLAVMIDDLGQHSSVRGHLNDGKTKFTAMGDYEKEALSLCRVDYLHASSPIVVRIGYSKDGFVVDVNGQKCFFSTEITLPSGYFGISANSDSSSNIFAVEKLSITQGLSPDMAIHLPQDGSNINVQNQNENQQKANENQDNKKSSGNSENQVVDLSETMELLQKVLTKNELVEKKIGQTHSLVEQLIEQFTISMNRKSIEASDLGLIQNELKGLRSQLTDLNKLGTSEQSENNSNKDTGTSIWTVLSLMVPVQALVVILYHAWLKHKERHEKLL